MYSVNDFNNANTIEIPDNIIETFNKLNRSFTKKNLQKHKYLKKTTIATDCHSTIKTLINKITLETYSENSVELIEEFDKFTDKQGCSSKIFDILSKNNFYSSLYASLYSKLIEHDEIFLQTLNNNIENINSLYDEIKCHDANENYDLFCKSNENNGSIKSLTTFYSYLLLNDNVTCDFIINNINYLIENIKVVKDNLVIFELLENINIYITITHNIICKHEKWGSIIQNIEDMKEKRREFSDLKNKCVFKCMDILDFVNNI